MKMDVFLPEGLSGFVAGIASDLDFATRQLKRHLKDLTPEQLTMVPDGLSNSIATIVVHMAGSEVYFAYSLLGKKVPDEHKTTFLMGQGDDGLLRPALGETVESLTAKLDQARAMLLESLVALADTNLDEELPWGKEAKATRRFYLSLLPYHFSSHTGQIQMVRKLVTR